MVTPKDCPTCNSKHTEYMEVRCEFPLILHRCLDCSYEWRTKRTQSRPILRFVKKSAKTFGGDNYYYTDEDQRNYVVAIGWGLLHPLEVTVALDGDCLASWQGLPAQDLTPEAALKACGYELELTD